MKLTGLLLFVIIINIGLMVFTNHCDPSLTAELGNETVYYTSTGEVCSQGGLVDYVFNFRNLKDSPWLAYLWGAIGIVSLGLIGLSVWVTRSEFPIYAGIAATLAITATSAIVQIWIWINSIPYLHETGIKWLIATILSGTLGFITLFKIIDWARAKD